jgi:O-antigen ligase
MKSRPARVHALCLGIFLAGALLTLFGGQSVVTGALGRQSNFTGRTWIWAAVIPAVSNPIVGDGYESFWIGPGQTKVARTLALMGWWHPETLNEAHNGYLARISHQARLA